MIVLYCILAIFIAWIWIEYFRLIDIFEKENLKELIATFILGGSSVLIVLGLEKSLFSVVDFELNGSFINDFLYCTFHIGAVEELAKITPFLLFYFIRKSKFNEPVDYLIYISISALGFSAVENVLYMSSYGAQVITGRSILSSVGHMFDTALIAYGFILYKYKKKNALVVLLFFLLASLSHGFYDFWLMYEKILFGWMITIIYFFVTISLFATILNNALNNSSLFTYKRTIDQNKIIKRLLFYYFIVFFATFMIVSIEYGVTAGIHAVVTNMFLVSFIVIVTVVRLSRFRLIKAHWFKLKIELPFSISKGDTIGIYKSYIKVSIKGDSFNDAFMGKYYHDVFLIKPLNVKKTYIDKARMAYVEDKIYLKMQHGLYLTKVFFGNSEGDFEWMIIKPKTRGTTRLNDTYPIVGLLKIDKETDMNNFDINSVSFKFVEWVTIVDKDEQ